jgi:hypothetical protein
MLRIVDYKSAVIGDLGSHGAQFEINAIGDDQDGKGPRTHSPALCSQTEYSQGAIVK